MSTAYAAFWTGIDGFSSSTVEQIGTLSQSSTTFSFRGPAKTTDTYYAWYEFYPSEAIIPITTATSGTPATVKPGDTISAGVTYLGSNNEFTLTITDETAGWTFATTGTQSGATESSAEWIAEAPSSSMGPLPLANFGKADFGNQYTSVPLTCYATVNGVSGSIGSFLQHGSSIASSDEVQSITMATEMGFGRHVIFVPEATPSPLSTDGTSFYITWNSAGSSFFLGSIP